MQAVASVNPNTVVVVHSVGPLIIEPWIDNPNVTAVSRFLSCLQNGVAKLVDRFVGPLGGTSWPGIRKRSC